VADITYSDFDMNFIPHPVRKDVVRVSDAEAVKRSILNLLLTAHYERPFRPDLGGRVRELLFEPFTEFTAELLQIAILEVIGNYEPRAEVTDLAVEPYPDENGFRVKLAFYMQNVAEPVVIDTVLERVR
jgi:phage baseplate assembly protein W